MLAKVITGGQTGVDQAALRAAKTCGIPTGGYAPKGWLTEAGAAPWLADFGLVEHPAADYPPRTRANVQQAKGLVWFGNPHSSDGRLTLSLCQEANIDTFVVISESKPADVADWIYGHLLEGETDPVSLMVAGNHESKSPGIGATTEAFLCETFVTLKTTA